MVLLHISEMLQANKEWPLPLHESIVSSWLTFEGLGCLILESAGKVFEEMRCLSR